MIRVRSEPLRLMVRELLSPQQFDLTKMYVLEIASGVPGRLQTHLLKLRADIVGGKLIAARASGAPLKQIIGQKFHVGPNCLRPDLLQEFLRRKSGRPVLCVGQREKQNQRKDDQEKNNKDRLGYQEQSSEQIIYRDFSW